MIKTTFSQFFDRSKLDKLDYEMALVAIEFLTKYNNDDNEVIEGLEWAARHIYGEQNWSPDYFDDIIEEDG